MEQEQRRPSLLIVSNYYPDKSIYPTMISLLYMQMNTIRSLEE